MPRVAEIVSMSLSGTFQAEIVFMELSGDIGRWDDDAVGLGVCIEIGSEVASLLPDRIPLVLGNSRVVGRRQRFGRIGHVRGYLGQRAQRRNPPTDRWRSAAVDSSPVDP